MSEETCGEEWEVSVFTLVEQKFSVRGKNSTEVRLKFDRGVSSGEFGVIGVPQSYDIQRVDQKYPDLDEEVWTVSSKREREGSSTSYLVVHKPSELSISGPTIRWCVDKLTADVARRHLREQDGHRHEIRTDKKDALHDMTGI